MVSPFTEGLLSPAELLSNSSKLSSLLTENTSLVLWEIHSENSGLLRRNHQSSDSLASSKSMFHLIPSDSKAVLGLSLLHFLPTSCLPSLHQTIAKYIKNVPSRGRNLHRYLLQKEPRRLLQHPQIKSKKPLFTSQNTQFLLHYLTLLRVHIINISLSYLEKHGIKHLSNLVSRFWDWF